MTSRYPKRQCRQIVYKINNDSTSDSESSLEVPSSEPEDHEYDKEDFDDLPPITLPEPFKGSTNKGRLVPWKFATPSHLIPVGNKISECFHSCRRKIRENKRGTIHGVLSTMRIPDERKILIKQIYDRFWIKSASGPQHFYMRNDVNIEEYVNVMTKLDEMYNDSRSPLEKSRAKSIQPTSIEPIAPLRHIPAKEKDLRVSKWLTKHIGNNHPHYKRYKELINKIIAKWVALDIKILSRKLKVLSPEIVNKITWLRDNAFSSEQTENYKNWYVKHTADPWCVFDALTVFIKADILNQIGQNPIKCAFIDEPEQVTIVEPEIESEQVAIVEPEFDPEKPTTIIIEEDAIRPILFYPFETQKKRFIRFF